MHDEVVKDVPANGVADGPARLTVDVVPDEASFAAFYADHAGPVLGLVIAVHGDRASAEEITQEAFAGAWTRWGEISRYDRPGAWVRRVALNLTTSRGRRLRTELAARARLRPRHELAEPSLPDDSIWRAVAELPRRQAQVVALTYLDDLDADAIADILKIDPSTVRAHLSRARRTLQARIEQP